jgi:hypothetical protein
MEDELLSPEQSLAIIRSQQAEVARRVDLDLRLIYSMWGGAWFLGFGLLWLEATDRLSASPAALNVVFLLLLSAAGTVTAVLTTRAVSGIGGPNTRAGTLYGLSWLVGLGGFGLLLAPFARAGADAELMALLSSTIAVFIVGLLYCAGAAVWREPAQFRLGLWIIASDVVASWVGLPGHYLVLSLAGGGGLLAAAVVTSLRRGW